MTLKYKDLKEKLANTPLNTHEMGLIDDVERYIDEEITKQFDKSIYKEITIDMCYPTFAYSPTKKTQISGLGVSRIPMMREELERRIKEAGWEISYRIDDSMRACDYMVLKGKD